MKTKTFLNLLYNQIEEERGKIFGEALEVNVTVTSLNLSCNEIVEKGANALTFLDFVI